MNSDRGWTDIDLSRIREELGKVEGVPSNQAPGYVSSEQRYSELDQHAAIEGRYQEGVHYAKPGVEIREERGRVEASPTNETPSYKNSEHWYNDHGDIPLGYGVQQTSGSYKSSEEYYSDGFVYGMGPNINGKTPSDLISSGVLTQENIKEEEKQIIYDDIMLGLTNNKAMLAKKIDLIISDHNMVNNIVSNQYMLAVEEMKKEEKGFIDKSPRNRKFQLLATVKILMEKGYDINNLKFKSNQNEIGLAKLLSNFRKECAEHKAKSINDPSWFKNGEIPENYDMRKVNNPWLFTGTLIEEIYSMNPQIFEEEYENYKLTTKMPEDQMLNYEEFMYYAYGIDLLSKTDRLQQFKEARARQIEEDQVVRAKQLSDLTQDLSESKERHLK